MVDVIGLRMVHLIHQAVLGRVARKPVARTRLRLICRTRTAGKYPRQQADCSCFDCLAFIHSYFLNDRLRNNVGTRAS